MHFRRKTQSVVQVIVVSALDAFFVCVFQIRWPADAFRSISDVKNKADDQAEQQKTAFFPSAAAGFFSFFLNDLFITSVER